MSKVVRIDSGAVSDHLSRLYGPDSDGWHHHVDNPPCRVRIIESGKATDKVEMTDEAVAEFLDDMAYQIEFSEGEYRTQCRRAVRQVRSAG